MIPHLGSSPAPLQRDAAGPLFLACGGIGLAATSRPVGSNRISRPAELFNRPVDKEAPVVDDARVGAAYAYELRRGDEILSTGRLTAEQELAPGDELTIAGIVAQVEALIWANGEPRLMLEPALRLTAS
jgi:hypothetical protein